MKRWLTVFGGIVIAFATAHAVQITGKITEAKGDTATAKVEGAVVPALGDRVEIFFTLAGADAEVSVAKGTVTKVEGDAVQVKIENASGEVTKDQLVRFTPGPGTAKVTTASSPSATPAVGPSPIPVTTPDVGTASALPKKNPPPSSATPAPRSQGKATPKPRPASTPATPEKKRFAGRWRVLNENPSYTLVLSQNGNKVTGTYDLQDGSLSGEVHGDILVAKWWQTGNQAAGAVRLKLLNDGEILAGPWTYDAASLSRGFTGGGVWTLRRIGASPMKR